MSKAREERLAHNEAVFRSVNEEIEGMALRLGDEVAYEFVCECSRIDCFERVVLSLRAYEAVRREGTRFVLRPGHEDPEIEDVVAVDPGYVVVEKHGVAALVTADADPRA